METIDTNELSRLKKQLQEQMYLDECDGILRMPVKDVRFLLEAITVLWRENWKLKNPSK
jgi:hypothetical protein